MTLGTKLMGLRRTKNLTQLQIAEELKVSQNAYNKWESDQSKPNTENLMKIADFYETDVYDLLNEIAGFNFNNVDCNYANIGNNSVFNNSPQVIETLQKSQEDISKLMETQNKLIEILLKNKS